MATYADVRRARDEFFNDSFDEMVEKIIDLRDSVERYRARCADIAADFTPDTDEDAPLALQEMRDAVRELGEEA